MRTVQMELLRPGELTAERERVSIVYLPVSPVEWHSYHMPMGSDALIAQHLARMAAQVTGGVAAPTLFIGTETVDKPEMLETLNVPHDGHTVITGMDFPANTVPSLYFREEVFAAAVREQMRLLANMGYRLIVVVNGHGAYGQTSTLRRLCAEENGAQRARFVLPGLWGRRTEAIVRRENMDPGHAERMETALMMAATHSVDLSLLPERGTPLHSADFGMASGSQFTGATPKDGVVTDDPRDATPELGEALFDAMAGDLAQAVQEAYRALD